MKELVLLIITGTQSILQLFRKKLSKHADPCTGYYLGANTIKKFYLCLLMGEIVQPVFLIFEGMRPMFQFKRIFVKNELK